MNETTQLDNCAFFVGQAGDDDDAARSGLHQEIQQAVCQEEVAQVVHTKLHFKSICSLPLRTAHDTCKSKLQDG